MAKAKSTLKPVVVCTAHRGVFFGYLEGEAAKESVRLKDARMAIAWGTTKGVMELAETGPTSRSKISCKADMTAWDVTAIFDVTPAAEEAWKAVR